MKGRKIKNKKKIRKNGAKTRKINNIKYPEVLWFLSVSELLPEQYLRISQDSLSPCNSDFIASDMVG
jgi:hypothetical protein